MLKNQVTTLKQNELSINCPYFSNINKIVRRLAWLLKLKHNWINWKRNKPEREHFTLLTFQELEKTTLILLRISQSESYPNDYNLLTTGQSLPPNKFTCNSNKWFDMCWWKNQPDLPNSNNQIIIICKISPNCKITCS